MEIEEWGDSINSKLMIRLNQSHYEESKRNLDDTQLVYNLAS